MKAVLTTLALCLAATGASCAQAVRPLGSVSTMDADVKSGPGGTMSVSGGRALLIGNSSVTAKDRTAEVSLTRGGAVQVCQSSSLHITQAGEAALLLALDRGALELKLKAGPQDVLLTPDLRFTPAAEGTLDLEIRVTRNGDTCVDNRGHKAPLVNIVDAYGQAAYQLKPGQHVFFEHGSLREVVDRETTPCGCPPEEHAVPLAEAVLRGGTVTPQQAAAAHPFPTAISEGLAEPAPPAPETPGETHLQIADSLTYDPTAKDPSLGKDPSLAKPPAAAAPVQAAVPVAPMQEAPTPEKVNPFRAVGRFFKRLFVR